ncbi:MAG: PAS domain S-box protein [Anaerolineae bacterium]
MPESILLVNDDAAIRSAHAHVLRNAGYTVLEAATGGEGLQAAQDHRPTLALLDVVLPDIDGLEICRRIKTDPALEHALVVLLSAYHVESESQAIGLQAGADGYLALPISPRELVARVETLLRLARSQYKLRERERVLGDLYQTFDRMTDGVFILDPDLRLLHLNRAAQAFLGVDRAAVIGQPVLETWPVARGSILHDRALEVLRTGQPAEFETYFAPTPYTNWFDVRIYPIAQGISVLLRVITPQKEAEVALARRDAFGELMGRVLARLAASTGDAIDAAIENGLQELAQFIGVDHAFVFRVAPDRRTVTVTHDWRVSDLATTARTRPTLPLDQFNWPWRLLLQDQIASADRMDELPVESTEWRAAVRREGAISNLVMPVHGAQGKVFGAVGLHAHAHEHHWTPEDVQQLQVLGSAIANALERQDAEAALDHRAHALEVLYQTLLEINGQHELVPLLKTIIARATELLHLHSGGLFLLTLDGLSVESVVGFNAPESDVGRQMPVGQGLAGRVVQTGELVIITDYQAWENRFPYLADRPYRRLIGVPLKVEDRVIGALILIDQEKTGLFTAEEIQIVSLFAEQAALSIENARLLDAAQSELQVREQAQQELAESERRYRTLFEESPMALCEEEFILTKEYLDALTREGMDNLAGYLTAHPEELARCFSGIRIVDANRACLQFYRAADKSELLDNLPPLVPPIADPGQVQDMLAIAGGATHFQSETRNPRLDGELRDILLDWRVMPGYEQSYGKVIVSIVDITERKQMQAALAREKEQLALTLDSIGDGMLTTDGDQCILLFNPRAEQLTGWREADALGQPLCAVFHLVDANDGTEMGDMISPVLRDGLIRGLPEDTALVAADGTRRYLSSSIAPVRDAAGAITGVVLLFRDVTRLRQAEEALRESEAYTRNLINSSRDMIIAANINRRIVEFNPAAEKALGYTRQEVLGTSPDFLYPDPTVGQTTFRRAIAQDAYASETLYRRKNGQLFPVMVSASPLKGANGKVIGTMGVIRDITRQKQAEAQLVRAEKLTALGRMAAALAHEINNPLQGVMATLDLVIDFELEPAERDRNLQIIRQEVERLSNVAQRTLRFARPAPSAMHPISVTDLVEHTLSLSQKHMQHAHIQVTTDFHPVPVVRCDPEQIIQVFLNLILNAIDAMGEQGHLFVTIDENWGGVAVAFTNDGPIIPPDQLDAIFEAFFTTKEEGTGLGLAISQSIVQQHGGTLTVENIGPERGVTFTVFLPALAEERDD